MGAAPIAVCEYGDLDLRAGVGKRNDRVSRHPKDGFPVSKSLRMGFGGWEVRRMGRSDSRKAPYGECIENIYIYLLYINMFLSLIAPHSGETPVAVFVRV